MRLSIKCALKTISSLYRVDYTMTKWIRFIEQEESTHEKKSHLRERKNNNNRYYQVKRRSKEITNIIWNR